MRRLIAILAVAALSMFDGAALAQATNGTIAGSIVDPTQAVVVGATVTATSLQTNDVRTATTNKVGGYRIESVLPGTYRIEVAAPGFATTTVPSTVVNTSVITSVNVKLTLGSAATTVEVSAEAVAELKTDSGELSETISETEMNNLPISSLNPYELATILPGVTMPTAGMQHFANETAFSVNGNRPRDNNFLIEGEDNNDQGLHGTAFTPENIEAFEETTFLLNSFPAEYGRGGAVSNLLLKSGSNTFHGAIYERLLNSALDGADKGDILNGNPKQKSRENLFGFRIGGPVIRDRLFFFVSNQWDRFRSTANLSELTAPTAAGYAALQNYANQPQVANLLAAYGTLRGTNNLYSSTISLGNDPVTNAPRGTVAFAGVQRQLGDDTNSRELEATSDLIVSQKDKVRFRFIQNPTSVPFDVGNFPSQLPGFDTDQSGTSYNAGIIHTHIFSPNVLNELRPAWSRIGFAFALPPTTVSNPLAAQPNVSLAGTAVGTAVAVGYGVPTSVPQGRFQDTYQLEDAITWMKGGHTFKFGVDIENQRIKDNIGLNVIGSISYGLSRASCTPSSTVVCPAGTGGYTSLGNFVDNYGGTASNATITFGNPIARPQIWVQSYYAEDSWKVLHNLVLQYGLRYEYDGTPFNYLPNPAFNTNNPAAFPGGVPELPNYRDFGPRAGVNYSFDGRTVLSAGFGLFYSHIFTNIIDNIQGSSPNAAAKQVVSLSTGRGTANWSTALGNIPNHNALATDTSNVIPQKLLEPLTYQYNLRLQRELPGALVITAEYVGNRSEHQYATTEFNPYINNQLSSTRIFPTRGRMVRVDNTADSNYNSGQFELQHTLRGGLTFRGVYTYSKLLDDGSEVFTATSNANLSAYEEIQYPSPRGREYAASALDHRNRVAVSAVYQPPTWHAEGGMRVVAAVVNGWMISGISTFQSGQPVNVEIGYDWNGDGINNDRPILLNKNAPITNWAIKGDDPIFGFGLAPGTLCDGPAWAATNDNCHPVTAANTHWVTSFEGTTQNTISRNALVSGHQSNTDASIARSFHTFERQNFELRVEALNVFNHGVTNGYNADLITGVPYNGTDALGNVYSGQVTFGQSPLTVTGGRTLRIYARYEF
jgi:hypothetical protein